MTKEKLVEIMLKHNIGREDLASISGKSVRQVYSWTSSVFRVPRSVALILSAIDDGKIDAKWIISAIGREHAGK